MSDEEVLRASAERLGIDLTTEDSSKYAVAASDAAAFFDQLEAPYPSDPPATDVTRGDDSYNAMHYRFEVSNGGGGVLGDLDIVVKENMPVAGVPMHCGSAALDVVPDYHASVVSRVQEAGATLIGTTHMDEFAYHTTGETCAFGPTNNPLVDERVPGGSSSGSAAAVAAGIGDAALGSDTGGSVRIPASYCGVVGLKPTYGRVSRFGLVLASPTLDHIGPIGHDVETTARVFDAIAGEDFFDPTTRGAGAAQTHRAVGTSIDGLTIGIVEEAFEIATDRVRDSVMEGMDRLKSNGIMRSHVSIPRYQDAPAATVTISGREFPSMASSKATPMGIGPVHGSAVRDALEDAFQSGELGDHVREQLLVGAQLNETHVKHYARAKRIAAQLTKEVSILLDSVDVLVTPTMPTTAPRFGEVDSLPDFLHSISHTAPFNLTGHPALTVPCGQVDGAPVGIQMIGAPDAEATLVAVGSALEN